MTLNNPRSGGSFVPEFQVAPAPWLTQSSVPSQGFTGYTWTTVARSLFLVNHGSASLNVGFSSLGLNSSSNFIKVDASASLSLDCRFTSIFVGGVQGQQFSLFVGLTGVGQEHIMPVTGSSGYTGVG